MHKPLTMTRILSDVDTVALMDYSTAANRLTYLRKFCGENYGNESLVTLKMAAKAFRQTTAIMDGDYRPLAGGNRSRFINPTHSMASDP